MTDQIKWRPIKESVLISRRPKRLSIAVAAVVVALIAAIALVGRDDQSRAQTSTEDGKPAGPAHTRQGAETAAAKAATAFGGERMFGDEGRRTLIEQLVDPGQRERMLADADDDYRQLASRIGLDSDGRPPTGAQFVSRTTPAPDGTTVRAYRGTTADVDVWCATVFGLTGKDVREIPPSDGWITMSLSLRWNEDEGWLVTKLSQREGPEPADAAFGATPQP